MDVAPFIAAIASHPPDGSISAPSVALRARDNSGIGSRRGAADDRRDGFVADGGVGPMTKGRQPKATLTPRQQKAAELIAMGGTTAGVAEAIRVHKGDPLGVELYSNFPG